MVGGSSWLWSSRSVCQSSNRKREGDANGGEENISGQAGLWMCGIGSRLFGGMVRSF